MADEPSAIMPQKCWMFCAIPRSYPIFVPIFECRPSPPQQQPAATSAGVSSMAYTCHWDAVALWLIVGYAVSVWWDSAQHAAGWCKTPNLP
jgi:hypothetical protein